MSAPGAAHEAQGPDSTVVSGKHEPTTGRESIHSTTISTGDPEKGPDSPKFDPAPEGGLRAWLIAAAGATVFFCTLGFANSFGTFVEYYATHQLKGESQSRIAWIGSLASFLQFFAGMVAGPMFDRYGEKVQPPLQLLYKALTTYCRSSGQRQFSTSSP